MKLGDRLSSVAKAVVAAVTFGEARASTKRGRNQLRIAAGLAMIAAAGFCLAKLIDPPTPAFGFWFWLFIATTMTSIRLAGWLFLTIEGGEE